MILRRPLLSSRAGVGSCTPSTTSMRLGASRCGLGWKSARREEKRKEKHAVGNLGRRGDRPHGVRATSLQTLNLSTFLERASPTTVVTVLSTRSWPASISMILCWTELPVSLMKWIPCKNLSSSRQHLASICSAVGCDVSVRTTPRRWSMAHFSMMRSTRNWALASKWEKVEHAKRLLCAT
jgi:hypothetical protein